MSRSLLIFLVCGFILLFANTTFWAPLIELTWDKSGWQGGLALAGFFLLAFWLLATIPLLAGIRLLLKPLLVLLLLVAAVVSYFQGQMGVIINEAMIQSLLETNRKEAFEFISWPYLRNLALLGLIPAAFVIWVPLKSPGIWREARQRLLAWLGLTLFTVLVVWFAYKDIALIGREHRDLRMNLNPHYALNSVVSFAGTLLSAAPTTLQPVGEDSVASPEQGKRRVVVMVLGETARRDHFSLNGYARETNPLLAKQEGLLFFKDVWSCGTATAESLPCIYSHLLRADFSVRKAWQFQNITDVLARVGVTGYWRDNNTGCKGVCQRIGNESAADLAKAYPAYCEGDECFDEILLQGLEERIRQAPGDVLFVLHQKGSHGPAYFKRYPQAFARFQPECKDSSPQNCPQEAIANAYDNTILYTDYVLNQAIDYLRAHDDEYESALFYVSDHGESLGENGIYLHGLPYFIAPDAQKQVPMLMWFSPSYRAAYPQKVACAAQRRSEQLSHDNAFHTLLGLFGVQTRAYDRKLDVVACP